MKKIIKYLLLFFCLVVIKTSVAQEKISKPIEDSKGFKREKVFFGGNVGAQFGNVTVVNVSPLVGYKITERIATGVGVTYIYYNYKAFNFSSSVYGGSLFGRFYLMENIFLHGEYELLNIDSYDFPGKRTYIENIYVGGGYRQMIGARSYMTIMALWNINESKYSPYGNPIIRMGFNVGF